MSFSFVLIVNCEVYALLFDMILISQFVTLTRAHYEMLAQSGLQLVIEEADEYFVEWFKEKLC